MDSLDMVPSSNMYQAVFDVMPLGAVLQNADGAIIAANPAAQRILGLSLDQMRGRTSLDPLWTHSGVPCTRTARVSPARTIPP
jgi:PAS domain S-box-containing protein